MSDESVNREPVFELHPNHCRNKGQSMDVGSVYSGPGRPARVRLTRERPFVIGEEYAIYVEHGILVPAVRPEDRMAALREALHRRKLVHAAATASAATVTPVAQNSPYEQPADPPAPTPTASRTVSEPSRKPSDEPPIVLMEAEPLEKDELESIPDLATLETEKRGALETLARDRGLWDRIEPTGKNNHRTVEDIREALIAYFYPPKSTPRSSAPGEHAYTPDDITSNDLAVD